MSGSLPSPPGWSKLTEVTESPAAAQQCLLSQLHTACQRDLLRLQTQVAAIEFASRNKTESFPWLPPCSCHLCCYLAPSRQTLDKLGPHGGFAIESGSPWNHSLLGVCDSSCGAPFSDKGVSGCCVL